MSCCIYADLTLTSALPLPELQEKTSGGECCCPDITVSLLDTPPQEPVAADFIWHGQNNNQTIVFSLFKKGPDFLLRFPDLADFMLQEDGSRIGIWPRPETSAASVRHLLLDQVLPRVIGYKGRIVVHASAVCEGGSALAFMGETGSGKSTLAASFLGSGCEPLSDDGLLLTTSEAGCLALPLYPGLRLWPQSALALFDHPPATMEFATGSPKKRIPLPAAEMLNPVHLRAIFVLYQAEAQPEGEPVQITPISMRDASLIILRNSFHLADNDRQRSQQLFTAVNAIAARVPCFTLSYPRDFSCLPSVREIIRCHSQTSPSSAEHHNSLEHRL